MLQTRCGDDADGEVVAVAGVVVAAAVQRDGGRARECVAPAACVDVGASVGVSVCVRVCVSPCVLWSMDAAYVRECVSAL
jgi:hypothetical protein